ncbi:hypothetical protein QQ045_004524 [Rhodiola kirilowii]
MTLLASPHLSTMLLIFMLYACISSQSIYSQNRLIYDICDNTYFPRDCKIYFSSHHDSTNAATIHAVGQIAFSLTEKFVSDTIDMLTHMISEYSQSHDLDGRLKTCKSQYKSILRRTISMHRFWTNRLKTAHERICEWTKYSKNAVVLCSTVIKRKSPKMLELSTEATHHLDIIATICMCDMTDDNEA